MIEGLALVSIGSAIAGAVVSHLATAARTRNKIGTLEFQNAYLAKRNADLRKLRDAAHGKERAARTAQFLAERHLAIAQAQIVVFEAREKDWSKRIMATMTEQEQGAV